MGAKGIHPLCRGTAHGSAAPLPFFNLQSPRNVVDTDLSTASWTLHTGANLSDLARTEAEQAGTSSAVITCEICYSTDFKHLSASTEIRTANPRPKVRHINAYGKQR